MRGSIAQYDQYEALESLDFLDFFDPFALTRDFTVFFEVNPYSAKICLTSDEDVCFSPIERCEILLTTESTFEGDDGPYRVVSAKDFGLPTSMGGTDFDDVLVARKGQNTINAQAGNDVIYVDNEGEATVIPGDGDDVIFLTAPTTDPSSNFVTILGGTNDDTVSLFVEEFV